MNFAQLATPIAVVGLVAMAIADLGIRHDGTLCLAVATGLLGWMRGPPTKPDA